MRAARACVLHALLAAAVMAGVALYERGAYLRQGAALPWARLWSDGAFTAAALCLGIGGLAAIARQGGFDALSYALATLRRTLRRPSRAPGGTYYDYVRQRHGTTSAPPFHTLALGAMLLAASAALALRA